MNSKPSIVFSLLSPKQHLPKGRKVKTVFLNATLQCQNFRGMTTTCCPGSNKSFWWGFAPDITDWTVICTVNWSWHPHQPAPVVKKNKPQSTFYKDAPFTKLQEKMCGLSALPWWPNSTAANRSWRRRNHSSPDWPWSCRLRTPRREEEMQQWIRTNLPDTNAEWACHQHSHGKVVCTCAWTFMLIV